VLAPVLALAQTLSWSALNVTRGIQPGLWRYELVAVPANPRFPSQSETLCIGQQDMEAALARVFDPQRTPDSNCQKVIVSNSGARAILEDRCRAVTTNVGVTIPAITARVDVQRLNQGHFVGTMTGDGTVWRTTLRRIRGCTPQ
jgi:hypothetical protein